MFQVRKLDNRGREHKKVFADRSGPRTDFSAFTNLSPLFKDTDIYSWGWGGNRADGQTVGGFQIHP